MRDRIGKFRLTYQRKLLLAFLLLALVPTLLLIATQKKRIERTIDFWQNPGVERALRESLRLSENALAADRERAADRLAAVRALLEGERWEPSAPGAAERLQDAAEASGLDVLRIDHIDPAVSSAPAVLLDYRSTGVPDSLLLPPIREGTPDLSLFAAARDSLLLPEGDLLRLAGALLLPEGTPERIRAVREGFAFYGQLRVYERYAKAKVAAQAALVLLAAAFLAFAVARVLSRSLGRPIEALVSGTARVREGDLDVRIEGEGSDEIGILIASFNEMARDLRASRERLARAERVATWAEAARRIAHEIKNPLTPITLSLHRLRKKAESLSDEERRALEELLAPMIEEVENLRSLAETFSQFSRLPSPRMEAVDVRDLLEKVAALYREGSRVHTSLAVDSETPPARGDRELLWRAFSNLVKNSIEAMEGSGELRLAASPSDGHVEILVSDDGPGIDPSIRDRIFAPTFTTKAGGSGLGLALVERILFEHGGTIAAEPNVPKGTTFRVRIPAWSEPGCAAPSAHVQSRTAERRRRSA
jgi:nitrogen fixation/metabolism regulation signal transduction histidine kinase